MESPLRVFTALGHQEVEMGVEIKDLSERLDRGNNTRSNLYSRNSLEVVEEGLDGCLAKDPPEAGACI